MQQAKDFLDESEALLEILGEMEEQDFDRSTLFKEWTVNDVVTHLHFWNLGADLSLKDPDGFTVMFEALYGALKLGNLRQHENSQIPERGRALVEAWRDLFRDMGERWQNLDPKTRVKWAGPDMSVRTSISARQMETWAHGQAIYDLLGKERPEADRIKNIVILGVNAFGWSHKVHRMDVPEKMPFIRLTAPSGEIWEFGEDPSNLIEGPAYEFCQVVTQTRNYADTSLQITGDIALNWMATAQCFAGPPEKPPEKGTRLSA
ncbi:MAG: TIGR03084 family metal-binding protein [Pseudomonadota bacterium]